MKCYPYFFAGNPGVATYYDEYQKHLYEKSNRSIPVWAVSHAGHVTGTEELEKEEGHGKCNWTYIAI
jgi:hypothetical protein